MLRLIRNGSASSFHSIGNSRHTSLEVLSKSEDQGVPCQPRPPGDAPFWTKRRQKGANFNSHAVHQACVCRAPVALIIAGLLPAGAFAHEHRDIDNGKYTVVVGWDAEPAYQGQPNAATVRISMADSDMGGTTMPALAADQSLHIQIREGDITMALPLHPVSGKPGSYAADLTPDRAGDVQWTLEGSINGDAVSERFDSADGKFDAVKPATTADGPMPTSSAETTSMTAPATTDYSAALDTLDASGLHDLDMSLEAGNLPSAAMERVHQAQLVMTTTG